MLATVHMLAGATIYMAVRSRSESLAVSAVKIAAFGVASHVVLDIIPHIEPATFGHTDFVHDPIVRLVGWVDNIVGAVTLLWLSRRIPKLVSVGAVLSVFSAWWMDAVQWLAFHKIIGGKFAEYFSLFHTTLHMFRTTGTPLSIAFGAVTTLCTIGVLLIWIFGLQLNLEHQRAYNKSLIAT